jgi:CubicO group peptidase (beta-lactamase class C family)
LAGDDRVATALGGYVDRSELAGVAALIWRGGKVVRTTTVGCRDVEANAPMTRDTIFRIASMTKPITSLAALQLLEEGAFALDDPIANWAHEFAHMRVLRAPDGSLHETDPAERPITFDDLLTHRAGLTYGAFHTGPIAGAYADALRGDIDTEVEPDDWIARLAGLPLIAQPGAAFCYGVSTDLLGLLIARIDGAPLETVLQRRIFRPLSMADTGFVVPQDKRQRRAAMYGVDRAGVLTRRLASPGAFAAERTGDMTFVSGGAGLWSTLDDYLRFARLFLGDGAVDGVRLLKPETLTLMRTNRLTENQRTTAKNFGAPVFGTGSGFGLGVATVIDPTTALRIRGRGGVGTVGWPGAFGGWWQADPTDGSVMIFLVQNLFDPTAAAEGAGLGAYAALMDFYDLATA